MNEPTCRLACREEDEKFNVWVAYLNMENLYGSEDATLALLSRALSHTDARRTYLAAVDIFERSQKGHLVEQCLKAMTRKFNDSVEVGDGRASGAGCASRGPRMAVKQVVRQRGTGVAVKPGWEGKVPCKTKVGCTLSGQLVCVRALVRAGRRGGCLDSRRQGVRARGMICGRPS
jgi:hypothetical protein